AATVVAEAVVEEHDAKCALLRELAGAAAPGALLATTTSSLSVVHLAAATGAPERFFGLHVFNPVPKMELVELAFPPKASEGATGRKAGRGLYDYEAAAA